MIGKLIAVLFLSRDLAHVLHLQTRSYAAHMALGDFYTAIVDLADTLAEQWQGRNGVIAEIPLMSDAPLATPIETLAQHLSWVEELRYTAIDRSETALQNTVDEIVGLYLQTFDRLRRS